MQTKAIIIAFALIVFGLLLSAPLNVVSRAQQPDPKQESRPRRVDPSPQTGPGSAPSIKPDSSAPLTKPDKSAAGTGEEVGDDEVVKVDTQLVSVPAVVLDATGRPLANLRAENFVLYEDNAAQRISNFTTTEAPFEVAVLLDTSGSTRADVALIKGAAKAFIDALRPGDKVSIAAFKTTDDSDSKLATVQLLTKLTSDRAVLAQAVEDIGTSNGTPFYDSLIRITADVFRDPPREELRGRRALVALTDGVDSSSNSEYAEVKKQLESAGVACYFIQVNTEEFVEDRLLQDCQGDGTLRLSKTQLQRYRHIYAPRTDPNDYADFCRLGQFERMSISRSLYSLARREMADLSRLSGGKTFEASELRDARAAFAQVAREIGTQYSLGYYPTNKARNGQFRQIRIVLKGVNGQTKVRAREGYYAPRA
jgi:VWFA-related protein